MKNHDIMKIILCVLLAFSMLSCKKVQSNIEETFLEQPVNMLNYVGTPSFAKDKSLLMYSDEGAWFAYGFPSDSDFYGGFSGPFLMTQENGVWSSPVLSQLIIKSVDNEIIDWNEIKTESYNSHLVQTFTSENVELKQMLFFSSGHTAVIKSVITNKSESPFEVIYNWESNKIYAKAIKFSSEKNEADISSINTNATGHIIFPIGSELISTDSSLITAPKSVTLGTDESLEQIISHSFIFPQYSWEQEKGEITHLDFEAELEAKIAEKEAQLNKLIENGRSNFSEERYIKVLSKSSLTLQNNWRIAAGELPFDGLFPSYHYKWFNGFWSWDSWKHAAGLSYYDTRLAQNQVKTMFDFQLEDGFIVDCIFRDTLIEAHNFRDTKPPLATWAVVKIFEKHSDLSFVEEMYPKLKKYHQWWYKKRDHDKDGLCEYGSTDGSLVAAKWESGMDNAIRFDDSKILKNSEGAYSIDQESVDLNAYLYAEKLFLAKLAKALSKMDEAQQYITEAGDLKILIQHQFYDPEDGWFYDTNLAGSSFIKGEGSEGWTALWANAATQEQAESVKNRMMDSLKFYVKVPFQTMSADHPKFNPLNGYWRGPNWLDQAYFGVKGLRNYGYDKEADMATVRILEGAEGLLGKGKSIRENYHPITGEGLNAQNFSWSAAHVIMLLMDE